MREFSDNNILALRHLQEVVRAADLDRALDMIGRAAAVYIIGLRRSFPVAAYLAYALRHVDKRAYLIDGVAGMLGEQAGIVENKDLLIAVSFHPYARETAEIVTASRARGAQILAISDSRLSPIAREADLYFEIKDAEVRQFRSLTASLCLAQTLRDQLCVPRAAARAARQLKERPRSRPACTDSPSSAPAGSAGSTPPTSLTLRGRRASSVSSTPSGGRAAACAIARRAGSCARRGDRRPLRRRAADRELHRHARATLIEARRWRGKAIFCEKPLDLDLERATRCLRRGGAGGHPRCSSASTAATIPASRLTAARSPPARSARSRH